MCKQYLTSYVIKQNSLKTKEEKTKEKKGRQMIWCYCPMIAVKKNESPFSVREAPNRR